MSVLDTSLLVDLIRPRGGELRTRAIAKLTELRARGELMATTRLNVAELLVGAESASDRNAELARVNAVLAPLAILEFDEVAARQYAAIWTHLRRRGTPAGVMDVLIAAVALSAGQTVVTRNTKDFAAIPGAFVEGY